MAYIDGFLVPVPAGNKDAYLKLAREAAAVFRDHGATRVVEAWQDDVPQGKTNDFFTAVKREGDELVVFSWIEWPSKAARDEGMAAAMKDARMNHNPADMPFSGARMIYGGFSVVVDS